MKDARLRACSFAAGLAFTAAALSPPADRWSERLLSAHMVQHLLLAMVAPPLLLLGGPLQFLLKRLPPPGRRLLSQALGSRAAYTLTRPLTGVAVFCAVVAATHFTPIFEVALRHPLAHAAEHAAYLASGLLLFAPMLAPASGPVQRAPNGLARFVWLTVAMVPMAAVGAQLSFGERVRYPAYDAPARALGRSALGDQHFAGAVMWVGGGMAMVALSIAFAMGAMLAEERRQRARDAYEMRMAAR